MPTVQQKKEMVLGFTLHYRKVGAGGKIYYKWYAYRKHNKKKLWVCVGDNKENSEKKIIEYCKNRGLSDILKQ